MIDTSCRVPKISWHVPELSPPCCSVHLEFWSSKHDKDSWILNYSTIMHTDRSKFSSKSNRKGDCHHFDCWKNILHDQRCIRHFQVAQIFLELGWIQANMDPNIARLDIYGATNLKVDLHVSDRLFFSTDFRVALCRGNST
jgi:hypothetical protein